MTNKRLYMDNFMESIISISEYNKEIYDGKDRHYAKMVDSLKNIMSGELTKRQRTCILLYYGENMKMKDISEKLGIGISSVSRHIKKAKARIKKTMNYYFS